MKRVLITGMSGTGKSTVIAELARRGYKAIDLDSDEWSEWAPIDGAADPFAGPNDRDTAWHDRDWVWREDRVRRLLEVEDAEILLVSGTASNQGKFRAQFDEVVLLSAPEKVLKERLVSRTTNEYGKDPNELARVLHHVKTVEPLLRQAATVEIDTSAPIEEVVDEILGIVRG